MSKPDVNFTIGADGSAFVGSMRKIQDSLNKIGQAFMGLQGIAAGLRTAFSAAMAPLQAYGELEDVKTQLGIMLNSEDAAERLTAALQNMATNGVVGMQDLVAAARSLARVLPQESIATWVGRFADIAAASKVPAERLASMVARLNDMGKAEFTELANAGIPIFEALGEVTGKSAQELQKMSAEGKVGVHDLLAAFELLTDAGGKFHEMNSKMSGTTLGSIATMKAQWGELLAEIGKPIAEGITPVLQEVTEKMRAVKPVVQEVFGFLVEMVSDVMQAVKPFTGEVFGLLVEVVMDLYGVIEALGKVLKALLLPVLKVLGEVLYLVCKGFEAVWSVVQKVLKMFEVVCKMVETLVQKFFEVIGLSKAAGGAVREQNTELELQAVLQEIAAQHARKKAQAEAEAAAELERQAKAASVLAKADAMLDEHFMKENEERVMRRESGAARRQGLMELHGVKDERELWSQIADVWGAKDPTEKHIERLRELLALDRQLAKMKKEEAEAEKKAADAAAEAAKKEAEDRKRAEREFRERQDAAREAAWEKNTTLAEKRAWYFGAGSEQMTPGEVTVAQVQADMEALVAEDPVKYAGMIADMEKWLAKVRELEDAEAAQKEAEVNKRNSARVDVVQSSLASVGGGGASIRIGDKQFREAQQHTKLLKAINDTLAKWPATRDALAVLG